MGSFVKSYGLTMLITCLVASLILVLKQFVLQIPEYSDKSILFMPAASLLVTIFAYIFFLNYIILFVIIVPIYALTKKYVTINWWSAIIIGLCVCSLNGFIIYLLMAELFPLMFALRLILLHGVLFGVILKLIHDYALSPSGIK